MAQNFPKARIAVTVAFIINGLGTGTFVSRIANYKSELNVSNFAFGVALLGVTAGVLVGVGPGGKLAAKYGSSKIIVRGSVFLALTFFGISVTQNYLEFILALFIYGVANGIQDVAMNSHAITVENKYQKKFFSAFHGSWSLGTFASAIIGSFMSQAKVPTYYHALIISLISITLILYFQKWFLPASSDIHKIEKEKKIRIPKIFFLLGLIGVCGQVGEGATGDWGSILARESFHVSPFVSTLPYIFFSLSMLTGRFTGDRLRYKYSERSLLIAGGLTAGAGMIAAMLFGSIYSESIGWLAAGMGLSITIPILFSQSGEIASNQYPGQIAPAQGVATVSGIAYSGFMAGPPLIGFFSEILTLRWALLLPGLLALLLAFGASKILKK